MHTKQLLMALCLTTMLAHPALAADHSAHADSGVDLSSVKEGDAVSFTLKPAGKDDYTISAIKKN